MIIVKVHALFELLKLTALHMCTIHNVLLYQYGMLIVRYNTTTCF